MSDDNHLGSRLRDIRVARGLKHAQVASVLGCHVSNISHIEGGRQRPTLDQLRALAKLFTCSIDDLVDVDAPLPAAPPLDASASGGEAA